MADQSDAHQTANQENQDLIDLLKSESGNSCFQAYLAKQYTEHHLAFWGEVEKYRARFPGSIAPTHGREKAAGEKAKEYEMPDMPEEQTKQIKDHAKYMYDQYVKVGTKNQVNLYTPIRNKVQEQVEKEEFHPALFDKAQKVVWDMFKGNYYRAFLQSDDYKVWKSHLEEEAKAKQEQEEANKKKSSACVIL